MTGQQRINIKKQVIYVHGELCFYCGNKAQSSELNIHGVALDHIMPETKGGKWELENLVPVCKSCNSSKWAYSIPQWIDKLEKQIQKANKTINRNKRILNSISFKLDNNNHKKWKQIYEN